MKYDSNKQRYIDVLLNKDISFKGISLKFIDVLFVIVLWKLAFIIRFKLFPIESADYYGFLEQWMNQIKELGGFKSLGTKISNYTSPYMYLMCLVSGFDNSLYALKMISVVFDYIASIAMFLIVHQLTNNTKKSIIGMALVLLSPTVIIDGAWWCQCDIIYTCIILWALYFFFKDDSSKCLIFIGIAFAFKLQTIFIVPFLLIMYLKKKTVRLLDFVYVPFVYIIAQLPAWMFGRPFMDLMMIYFEQSGTYPWGTLEYPNTYALLDETIEHMHHMNEVTWAGTWLTIILLGTLAYYIYSKHVDLTNDLMVTLALFSVAIIVYTLPHMHDRYGFLIDLLAILYAVLRPKRLPVMVGFMLVSILTFMPYLVAVHIFDIKIVAIALLGLITYVGYDLYNLIKMNEKTES